MFKELNILKLFLEEPNREFNVRELARILKIAPATASKELKRLTKENILMGRKERIFNLYKANINDGNYKDIKIFYNLRSLKNVGLINFLNKFYLKPTIVLFGSAAFGMDTETSDFDILIISEKDKEFNELDRFEKKIKRKIQLFVVKNIKDMKNKHLINNVVNGITIQGDIKWI